MSLPAATTSSFTTSSAADQQMRLVPASPPPWATSTTAARTSSLPPLLRLPPDVVTSIAQLLTICEKLKHFTRLHRSLPRLTAAAFRHDSLLLEVWRKPMPPHLRPLLSAVSSLSCNFEHDHLENCADFCSMATASSTTAPSTLVNLRHLALRIADAPSMASDDPKWEQAVTAFEQLSGVLSSPNIFPRLTSVALMIWEPSFCWFRSFLSCLPTVRVIVVKSSLSTADLLALLRLPAVERVEVDGRVQHNLRSVIECGCQRALSLSAFCHTLLLPLEESTIDGSSGHRALVPLLLSQQARGQ